MRSGSQPRTMGGSAGCMTAMPAPIAMVAANSMATSAAAPRAAAASALTMRPAISAGRAPKRAMMSEPGTAAAANRSDGRPANAPIAVSERSRSRWMNGSKGGTASTVMRKAAPLSQMRPSEVKSRRGGGASPRSQVVRAFMDQP